MWNVFIYLIILCFISHTINYFVLVIFVSKPDIYHLKSLHCKTKQKKNVFPYFFPHCLFRKTLLFLISDFPMKFYHYIFERTSLLLFSKNIFQKIFGAKQGKQSLHFFWKCHWFAISTISDLCRIVFWVLNIIILLQAIFFILYKKQKTFFQICSLN